MLKVLLKISFVLPLMVLCGNKVSSQSYILKSSFGNSYVPLSNPTVITNSWDNSLITKANVGVTFSWFGKTWPFDGQGDDGLFLFGAGTLAGGCPTDSTAFDFDGFFASLQSRSQSVNTSNQSAMSGEVDGTAPNRIIKIEWNNAGLTNGDTSDFVNFQIWIYENATFEVHFGPSSIKDANAAFGVGLSGPPIGLFFGNLKKADNGKVLKAYYLTGSPANPVVNDTTNYNGLTSMPVDGTTYTFTYSANSGFEGEIDPLSELSIYPNPASSLFRINYNVQEPGFLDIDILNITGQRMGTIYSGQVTPGAQDYDFNASGYEKGIYLIRFRNINGIETRKLVIE